MSKKNFAKHAKFSDCRESIRKTHSGICIPKFTTDPRSTVFFTITAENHARSLAKFYGQYADRHINLKFVRRVSEREREIRQSVIAKNKLMSVFNASVLLLTMNFVITLSK